jgi:alpha-ribazole phosphatase
MKSQIHLIRHGITVGNKHRLFYGASDIELAEEGIEALKVQTAEGLYPYEENSDFYTSGMIRTEQTLELIYGQVDHEVIPEFREVHCGVFEMKSFEELKDNENFQKWIKDGTGQTAPEGGESIVQFNERVQEGFRKLVGKHRLKELSVRHNGKPAVSTVVCHGGVICAILQENSGEALDNFFKWMPDPGHGYTLTMEDGEIIAYEKF